MLYEVITDNAFGMVKWKQANMGYDGFGLDVGNPDFVAYAESYGAHGHAPSSAAEFLPMLNSCFASPGVHVISVPIDYSDNDRVLSRELKT